MAEWKFRSMPKSEIGIDPFQGQFFNTYSVESTTALVRESIQNSLDARLKTDDGDDDGIEDRIVTVRFYLSRFGSNANIQHLLFKSLYPHLITKNNGLDKSNFPSLNNNIPFLLIEDFQTTGLCGDVNEFNDPIDGATGHDFYWFWRNIGRTGKRGTELGRWGLGKTVFPASSRINSFFGLTLRENEDKMYLMGQSVLKVHTLDNLEVKFCPYGYLGVFNDSQDMDFASPIDNEIINDFIKIFSIKRSHKTGPGLSIVVPFPFEEITTSSILKSVLMQYFYPIISGSLIVEVVDGDTGEEHIISDETIFQLLENILIEENDGFDKQSYKKLYDLCLWALKHSEEDYIKLLTPNIDKAPRWSHNWYFDDALTALLKEKADAFEMGKRISFKVPVRVKETNTEPSIRWFNVYLENDDSIKDSDCHFIRGGITITDIGKEFTTRKGIRAIVEIQDEVLVKLLGDAENPAHTQWQPKTDHFRGKYEEGEKVLGFISRCIDNLCYYLIKTPEGIDKDLLKDIFFVEMEDSGIGLGGGNTTGPETQENDIEVEPKIPPPIIIKRIQSGLSIIPNPKHTGKASDVTIIVAYNVSRGSAKWSRFDFDLSKPPIKIQYSGISNLSANKNQLKFNTENSQSFEINLEGFDQERDLFIKADYNDQEI